jgi:hypothetical protein
MMKTITMASLLALTLFGTTSALAAPCPEGTCTACKKAAAQKQEKSEENRFGGPVYNGAPALAVTASLVEAGGGAENFSIAKALTAMGGEELVKTEVEKLTKQYGAEKVQSWIMVFDFAVKDALRMATEAGVKLPKGKLSGKKLASTLVTAGLDKSHTFNTCSMLDKAISHKLHVGAMESIDKKFGAEANANYHTITNQAMYDFAQALGMKKVKLSSLH